MASPLIEWLREHTASWRPSIVGVFREDALHDWPLSAGSAPELRQQLTAMGHLLPLPSEPAALANVMEIELRRHLLEAALLTPDAEAAEGTERSYPDLSPSVCDTRVHRVGPGHRGPCCRPRGVRLPGGVLWVLAALDPSVEEVP